MSAMDTVLSRVKKKKRISKHEWEALCPSHDDGDPSLSIADKGDRILLYCHGGCSQEAVVAALGLSMKDLFNENGSKPAQRETATKPELGPIVETYDYTDENGVTLFQVTRHDPKDFRQRRPNGNGGWTWGIGDTRRVLFHLPEVLEAVALGKTVYVTEGEKDALALEKAGAVATCNAGGAGKWRDEYSETLRDARVVIVADKDEAGRKHAHQVAEALEGLAASVELSQAREGKDAADHLAAGHGLSDFVPMQEAEETDGTDGEGEKGEEKEIEPLFDTSASRFGRFLASTPPEREWVWQNVLPAHITGILGSAGGAGKSVYVYQLGLHVCTGVPFLGLEMGEPGSFLYLAAEDDEDELHRRGLTILDHFETLALLRGMDPREVREAVSERLHVVSRVAETNLLTHLGADGEVKETALVDRLLASAVRIPDLRVIVTDPISRFRGGSANLEEHATRFVETLEKIRHATGATVLGLAHINQVGVKDGGGQEIIRGSTALVDGVRFVATLQTMRRDKAKDYGVEREEARRYLQFDVPKNNYAPPFEPVWLRREDGGVLVPAHLVEKSVGRTEGKYMDVLGHVQELLEREGPMTENRIATGYAGELGPLGAGEKAVRDVLKSAVVRGDLVRKDNTGRGGGQLLDVPGRKEP